MDFYYKPWVHLSSYLIGSFFGFALYSFQTGADESWLFKVYRVSIFRFIMNLLMALLGLATLFSIWLWNSGLMIPQFVTAFYASTFRFGWSLSILWFVYKSTIERSGLIYEFLSWPGWLPISRLTYSGKIYYLYDILSVLQKIAYNFIIIFFSKLVFLFHPLVIWMHFGTAEHSLSYNHQEFIRMFTSNLFLSIILALISNLIFEAPIINIQKLIFNNSKTASSLDKIKFNHVSNSNQLKKIINTPV